MGAVIIYFVILLLSEFTFVIKLHTISQTTGTFMLYNISLPFTYSKM